MANAGGPLAAGDNGCDRNSFPPRHIPKHRIRRGTLPFTLWPEASVATYMAVSTASASSRPSRCDEQPMSGSEMAGSPNVGTAQVNTLGR